MEQSKPEPLIHVQIAQSLAAEMQGLPGGVRILEHAASQALQQRNDHPILELTLLLTDDQQMRELNWQFMGLDEPTDVLSFPAGEVDPDTQAFYLGDVALSLPRARSQAEAGGNSLQSELQLLVVHGVLHLLGYDHADETRKAAMWVVQSEVLSRLADALVHAPGA